VHTGKGLCDCLRRRNCTLEYTNTDVHRRTLASSRRPLAERVDGSAAYTTLHYTTLPTQYAPQGPPDYILQVGPGGVDAGYQQELLELHGLLEQSVLL
jgi:hypothetical protein